MDWQQYFFSTTGRLNRSKYWLGVALLIAGSLVAGVSTEMLEYMLGLSDSVLVTLIRFVALIAVMWGGLALIIKRLHDRDMSGWWFSLFWILPPILLSYSSARGSEAAGSTFLFFYMPDFSSILNNTRIGFMGLVLPIIASALTIWGFIEIGCLRGTVGPNQFGPDPLGEVPSPR